MKASHETAARLLGGLLALAGGLFLALAAPRLTSDRSLAQLFPRESVARARFADFDRAFGTDDTLLVTVTDRGETPIFNRACLEYLQTLAEALQADPAVELVVSPATLEQIDVMEVFGRLAPRPPRPFIDPERIADDPAELERLRSDRLLAHGLVSEDGRTAATWVLLDPGLRNSPAYAQEAERLADGLPDPARWSAALEVRATGFPLLYGAAQGLLWRDGLRFLLALSLIHI